MPNDISPPEPNLTPEELIRRATALRPLLRERQAECEATGNVPADVNAELIRAGFYRTIQPRRFGGYEFDVPTFYKVMMEVGRGCPETGWVVALTSGHPLIVATFPEQGQREVYGKDGEFRCPAGFNPPGKAFPAENGFRVSGAWVSASGIDLGTHFITSAVIQEEKPPAEPRAIQLLLDRSQYEIVDDWHVMGMQGTGSKSVIAKNVFVPTHRTVPAVGLGRGAEPAVRNSVHENPMYGGRIACFLIGESSSVAVGAARGALDIYEEIVRTKPSYLPPHHPRMNEAEFQQHYGHALGLIATAETALVRAGQEYMEYALEEAQGGAPFDDERDLRLMLIKQKCIRMAWEAVDVMFRSVGTSHAAKDGQPIGRIFRNLAVINTHPALQLEKMAIRAARVRFGLQPQTQRQTDPLVPRKY